MFRKKKEIKSSGSINIHIPNFSFDTFEYETNREYVLNDQGDGYILIIKYDIEQCVDVQTFGGWYTPFCCPSTC